MPAPYNEQGLVTGLKEKDSEVFATLYEKYAPALFGVICREVDVVKIAEEILEKTFLTLWENPVIDDKHKDHFLLWMISLAKTITVQTNSDIAIVNSEEKNAEHHAKSILLVDDDENLVELVKYILTSYGFIVHTHPNGLNVNQIAANLNPNLIILDVNLPGKSGIEICKELKQTTSTPIILFSYLQHSKEFIKESNADSFIGKPFDISELITAVDLYSN